MKIATEAGQNCIDCGKYLENNDFYSLCWQPDTALCNKCDLRRFRNETKKHVQARKQKEFSTRSGPNS